MHTKIAFRSASLLPSLILTAATLVLSTQASAAVDEKAAMDLARHNSCFKCHGVDKAKDGPAWNAVAKKLKGDKNAEAKLMKHLTTGPKVKAMDGTEEDHPIIKAKSPADIKNLIAWILSLK